LVYGALDVLALLVGGGLAEQLRTGGDILGYLADLVYCTPCSGWPSTDPYVPVRVAWANNTVLADQS
jgi:hypothetical protein